MNLRSESSEAQHESNLSGIFFYYIWKLLIFVMDKV